MNALAVRREARRRARQAHIADLERGVGLEPSYDVRGLPRIVVERNPTGSWTLGDRWIALGFDPYGSRAFAPRASTKRLCIRRARKRLRLMVGNELRDPIEVKL
jgi:hypothetical protein